MGKLLDELQKNAATAKEDNKAMEEEIDKLLKQKDELEKQVLDIAKGQTQH
jgi:hypothetical protein